MEKRLIEEQEFQEVKKIEKKMEKWRLELQEIKEKQKEINCKYDEKIEEIQKNMKEGKKQILLQNNQMIARIVRENYGEIDFNTVESFREKMKQLKQEEKQQDTFQSEKYLLE